jgi:hypothetical protein
VLVSVVAFRRRDRDRRRRIAAAADLVILCAPVAVNVTTLSAPRRGRAGCRRHDVGSTKRGIVSAAEAHGLIGSSAAIRSRAPRRRGPRRRASTCSGAGRGS